ncbi:hypothetical protein [Algiphilus sp.]|uniref:hypothetical protein n=1 Tax=Algiphilus sp. TaxID=1872431 RepID=UPI0025BFC8FF|nr:hypothetical protein [Algiphilus sp.]MCK5770301.1 hypothetical protein [Algiphilus sp.]
MLKAIVILLVVGFVVFGVVMFIRHTVRDTEEEVRRLDRSKLRDLSEDGWDDKEDDEKAGR